MQDDQINVWKYQRYGICEEYEGAVSMPPPFTPIEYLIRPVYYIYKCIKARCQSKLRNPNDPDVLLQNDLADNESRIIKWKEHVLESLMKEASITYCQKKQNGQSEITLRNVFNDVAKPLQDRITMLDLQNKLLQRQEDVNNLRGASVTNSVGKLRNRLFRRKPDSRAKDKGQEP